MENEKTILSEAIWRFPEIFPPGFRNTYKIDIESKDIIKKFINFLKDSPKDKANKDTMLTTLKVLR